MALQVIVSPEDSDLEQRNWYPAGNGYPSAHIIKPRKRGLRPGGEYLHRVVIERKIGRPLIKGEHCDHINRNICDARRENLRVGTKTQNQGNVGRQKNNKSGFKGVFWNTERNCWRAQINFQGKNYHLGRFKRKDDAARAYNEAAIRYFGEFASLNSIDGINAQA